MNTKEALYQDVTGLRLRDRNYDIHWYLDPRLCIIDTEERYATEAVVEKWLAQHPRWIVPEISQL